MMKRLPVLFFSLLFSGSLFAQTPCENGQANGYPCENIDLLGHVSPQEMGAVLTSGVYLNDIWGWTDPETGREYVINGMSNGTAFVDITDPLNPVVLGVLPEPAASSGGRYGNQASAQQATKGASAWRDVKIYANHAFIVSDANGEHGMQVFDLTVLRNVENPPATFSESGHYGGIGRAHNVVINESEGYAYIVGARGAATCGAGGLHIVDIRDPKNPVYAGCFDGDGYTHDAQVVTYHGPDEAYQGKEIAFAANEDAVTIVDVSDKTAPSLISTQSYSGVEYVHQGWLTEDHAYFLSNDELDESRNGHNTRTYVWDVRDLGNPTLIGTYTAELPTIDHNLYIRDTLVYESNYTSGLRILNAANIADGTLSEVAFFDTYPADNSVSYNGTWSNYPFFESGVIAVSDINNGLFLLRSAYSQIRVHASNTSLCESTATTLKVIPRKENTQVRWQVEVDGEFVDLEENTIYSNVGTTELIINHSADAANEFLIRALMDNEGSITYSNEVLITKKAAPTANFSFSVEENEVSASVEPVAGTSYTWKLNGEVVSHGSDVVVSIGLRKDNSLALVAENGCGSAEKVEVIESALGIEEEQLKQALRLFPNPATEQITVQLEKSVQQLQEVTLFALNGQQIKQAQPQEPQRLNMSFSGLAPGMYLLQITTNKTRLMQRLIIQ